MILYGEYVLDQDLIRIWIEKNDLVCPQQSFDSTRERGLRAINPLAYIYARIWIAPFKKKKSAAYSRLMWVRPYSYCHLLWAQNDHYCAPVLLWLRAATVIPSLSKRLQAPQFYNCLITDLIWTTSGSTEKRRSCNRSQAPPSALDQSGSHRFTIVHHPAGVYTLQGTYLGLWTITRKL